MHWDGKMLPDLVGTLKVDRIAILVSYGGTSKFLGAPKLLDSKAENIAGAVWDQLTKWKIADQIIGMSFDTTSSNTGKNAGACVLLQKKLGRLLLELACRHHIYELFLRAVFELKLFSSSAPDVQFFERFRKCWCNLDLSHYQNGLVDEIVASAIPENERIDIKSFCTDQLVKSHARDDYKEFLQLVLMFLGENVASFRAPGPTSNARWMAKAIYSLKMFLFRGQFHLNARETKGLRDMCIFLIRIYVKVWFGCTNAVAAPNQDLEFIKTVIRYADFDNAVSQVILNKMKNHFWYLSVEMVALALLDTKVSLEEKRKMLVCMDSQEPRVKLQDNRKYTKPQDLAQCNLSDFVSKETANFFTRFGLSTAFLQMDPSTWQENIDFKKAYDCCKNLFVVNDTAERGVKFMSDYNRILTNDEEEKQMMLQIVEKYRKQFSSFKKTNLIS